MPRLKPSPDQMQDLALDAAIASHAALLGLRCKKDVAERLKMEPGTYCKRLDHKQRWTLPELRKLFKTLGFTPEEILRVFGKELKT